MKILFIEDSEDDRLLIEAVLRQEDCSLCFAKTYVESADKIESFKPDLIVIDLTLSDSQPAQTIVNISKLARNHATVVLSGDESSKSILEAKKSGAIEFIRKSVLSNGPELFSRLLKSYSIWRSQNTPQGSSPLAVVAMKKADIPTAELILMLQKQNETEKEWKDYVKEEFRGIKESQVASNTLSESRHLEYKAGFQAITNRQDTANGSVNTLKAKVKIMEDANQKESEDKTKAAIKTAIEAEAIKNYKENTFSIRKFKLTKTQWAGFIAVLTFLGWDRVVAWTATIWHLFIHIYTVLFG